LTAAFLARRNAPAINSLLTVRAVSINCVRRRQS
jgi:hypothetical protein